MKSINVKPRSSYRYGPYVADPDAIHVVDWREGSPRGAPLSIVRPLPAGEQCSVQVSAIIRAERLG